MQRIRDPQYPQELGHKTIIKPEYIAKYFRVIHLEKGGHRAWFQGRKGTILRNLGLKDRTRLDSWFYSC